MASPDVDRERVRRRGLYEFAKLAWSQVDTSEFAPGWHLEEMAKHLEAVSAGECRKLVINVPPGMTKSLLCQVFWPAWDWIQNPSRAFFFGAYAQDLLNKTGNYLIKLIRSRWYVERWGQLLPERGTLAASDFRTAKGGWRFGSTPGGEATGHHFDIHCVDDPIKPKDAEGGMHQSSAFLDAVRLWYHETLSTRFRNKAKGARVLVMQRLHEEDLAGECIDNRYDALVLPMRYEPDRHCITPWGGDRRTVAGELLCPARYDEPAVLELEMELADAADAQLQQRPTRKGGQIIQEHWLTEHFWSSRPFIAGRRAPESGFDVISADLTFKGKTTSDFVAMGAFRRTLGHTYLMEAINKQLEFTYSVDEMEALSKRWPRAYDKLVEDKANGPALESTLRDKVHGIVLVDPSAGKIARLRAASPMIRAGLFHLRHPDEDPLTKEIIRQLTKFPNVRHDDLMDMITQALIKLQRFSNETFSAGMEALRKAA